MAISIFQSNAQILNFATGTEGLFYSQNKGIPLNYASSNVTEACSNEKRFWGFDESATRIIELKISENKISLTGNVLVNPPGFNLAICNNLTTSSETPTFYCSNFASQYFLDENGNWVSTGNSVNTQYNCGGYKNKLYSISYQNQITEVNMFNGQSYTAIYSTAKPVVCADIALDENGNFFLLTATSPGAMSDTLYLISENGTVLKKYALELNSNHIYGSFYFDHTLYLGIGKNNNEHPNSLIPISFMGNTALIQPQLALPSGIVLEYDLAACKKTIGTLLADSSSLVYPNIFSPNMDGSNDIFVAIEKNISQLNCKIYNRYGILVSELKEVKSAWDGRSISGMELPAGVYYYIATGRGTDEKEYDLSGFVHLVR